MDNAPSGNEPAGNEPAVAPAGSPPGAPPRHPRRSFRRDALSALAIVLLLEGLTLCVERMPWWERYTWPFHDLFMRTWRGQDPNPETAKPLAFIDIDDLAFVRWGTSGVTNRKRVRDLIRFAAEGEQKASLIIIDLDLSHPDPGSASGDEALLAWLRDYHDGPHLIFSRALGPAPPEEHIAWQDPGSLIDPVVANNPLIHFATAAFEVDTDGSVRRWRLLEAMCGSSRLVVLPSVELLAVAIMDDPTGGAHYLKGVLDGSVRGRCDRLEPGMVQKLTFRSFPGLDLFPGPDSLGERILYTQPWPVLPRAEHRVAYLPALPILERQPSTDRVKDRIVVIGGSNTESRDLRQTPIGAMPGAMVLLNSINALLQQGQLHAPDWWLALPISVVLGMGVWLCLYVFQFAIALVLAAGFVFIATWLVATYLIGHGIWLDMAVPSFGMLLHRWASVLETIHDEWSAWRWRAILTERFRGDNVTLALVAGLSFAGLACAGTARAADPMVAGHISGIMGDDSAKMEVEHAGTRIPARYWANVFDGDQIIVTGNGQVEIAPDGPVVTRATSPAVIRAKRRTPLIQAFAERFGWILSEFSDRERKTAQLIAKDFHGSLAMQLLTGPDHQRVVAGVRRLTVAWSGGKPPFITTLTTGAGMLTLTPAANEERRASAYLQLGVGGYEVRVSDVTGAIRSAKIDAVADAPAIDETGFADAPDDIRLALASVQLAKSDDGHWRLEAFERLTEAAPASRVARILSNRLVAGLSLDDPHQ